jgi:hypothetical protein
MNWGKSMPTVLGVLAEINLDNRWFETIKGKLLTAKESLWNSFEPA